MKAKSELRIKEKLPLRAMGISNRVYDTKNKKHYSVQFYDFDGDKLKAKELNRIKEIFPYDLIMYQTKHGFHFISFALLHGLRYTKSKAVETSKELGNQDYWTEAKDLTLRVSPKWKLRKFRKRKVISCKPRFFIQVKKPNGYIVSNKHVEFYFKYMNLPETIYNEYQECILKDYSIRVYHYKTRD